MRETNSVTREPLATPGARNSSSLREGERTEYEAAGERTTREPGEKELSSSFRGWPLRRAFERFLFATLRAARGGAAQRVCAWADTDRPQAASRWRRVFKIRAKEFRSPRAQEAVTNVRSGVLSQVFARHTAHLSRCWRRVILFAVSFCPPWTTKTTIISARRGG